MKVLYESATERITNHMMSDFVKNSSFPLFFFLSSFGSNHFTKRLAMVSLQMVAVEKWSPLISSKLFAKPAVQTIRHLSSPHV